MARLKQEYDQKIRAALQKQFGYKNVMEIPRLTKITLNMGVGDAVTNSKVVENVRQEMALIAGQQPVVTHAKKAISSFKIREGMALGCKVTLRGERMYEFLDRLVNTALPRVRDFRGLNHRSFDGQGNYSMGIKEHIVFPEINYDKVEKVRGMDICFTTTAKTNEEALALLTAFNMPFTKARQQQKAA